MGFFDVVGLVVILYFAERFLTKTIKERKERKENK